MKAPFLFSIFTTMNFIPNLISLRQSSITAVSFRRQFFRLRSSLQCQNEINDKLASLPSTFTCLSFFKFYSVMSPQDIVERAKVSSINFINRTNMLAELTLNFFISDAFFN